MDVAVGNTAAGHRAYTEYVNSQWARLPRWLDMDAGRGETLRTFDGCTLFDSLSGSHVRNAGYDAPPFLRRTHATSCC
jgi:hypothetical protein